jgi:hypothetical protein
MSSKEVRVSSLTPVEEAISQAAWHEHVTKRVLSMYEGDVLVRQSYNLPNGGSGSGPNLRFSGGCEKTNRAIPLFCWALIDGLKIEGAPKDVFFDNAFIQWMDDTTVRELVDGCSDAVKRQLYPIYIEWLKKRQAHFAGQHDDA